MANNTILFVLKVLGILFYILCPISRTVIGLIQVCEFKFGSYNQYYHIISVIGILSWLVIPYYFCYKCENFISVLSWPVIPYYFCYKCVNFISVLSWPVIPYYFCYKCVNFISVLSWLVGARCSSVVRAFTHGAMGHQIYPSWWTHWAISLSSQCSTTGATKTGMCYPVCGIVHIKEPLLLIGKSSLCGSSGFPPSISWPVLPYYFCYSEFCFCTIMAGNTVLFLL